MSEQKPKKTVTLYGCGISLIGIVLAVIICIWIVFHGSVIWDFLDNMLKIAQGQGGK